MIYISIILLFTSINYMFCQNVELSNKRNETKEKNNKQDDKVKLFLDYNEKPPAINNNINLISEIITTSTIKIVPNKTTPTTTITTLPEKNSDLNLIKDTNIKNQKETTNNLSTTIKLLTMRRAGTQEPYSLKFENGNIQDILKTWKRPERLHPPTRHESRKPIKHIPKKPLLPNDDEINDQKNGNILEILLDSKGISKKLVKTDLPLRVVPDPTATNKVVNNKKRFEKKTRSNMRQETQPETRPEMEFGMQPETRPEMRLEMPPDTRPEMRLEKEPKKPFGKRPKKMLEKNSKTKGKRPKKVIEKKEKKRIQKRTRDSDELSPIASIKKDILRKSKSPRPLSARLMDMAPAKGARVAYKRQRNRLCHRSVMIPEGPKYDSKGMIYMAAFAKTNKRSYPQTDRPKVVLPRCCNCCKKSVLGCE